MELLFFKDDLHKELVVLAANVVDMTIKDVIDRYRKLCKIKGVEPEGENTIRQKVKELENENYLLVGKKGVATKVYAPGILLDELEFLHDMEKPQESPAWKEISLMITDEQIKEKLIENGAEPTEELMKKSIGGILC